jgi:hypothetical protein
MVAVTVTATIQAFTWVGQITYGTRTVKTTSRMALSP